MTQKTKGKPSEIDIVIGKNLKKIRLSKGFSQSDLATAAGITFQQIQKYERGTNRVAASRLVSMAGVLTVNIDEFYMGIVDYNPRDTVYYDASVLKLAHKISRIKDEEHLLILKKLVKVFS